METNHNNSPSHFSVDTYQDKYRELIQSVLALAAKKGASASAVTLNSGAGLSVTVRMGEVDKIEHERDKYLALTLYSGTHKGSASTSDFSERSLINIVDTAWAISQHAAEDSCFGLAKAQLMATSVPDLVLYHPWEISPQEAIEMATTCENHALEHDSKICNSEGAMVSTYSGLHLYGNSHDFIGGWPWSTHSIDCSVIAKNDTEMQRDGWYSRNRVPTALQDVQTIGERASQRAVSKLGAKKMNTCQTPVIFEAEVAGELLATFINAISGGSLYRKASFLLDKKDTQIFSDHIKISEQPHIKKALGSAPFDNDGILKKNQTLVQDGTLLGYLLSTYSARRLGLETTANAGGVNNLVIEPSQHNLIGLIKMIHKGLLITDMIGFGVNQITGDYSRGVSGFWIENGQVSHPVEEITVAGNLASIYKNIVAIGCDIERRGNILTGSILVDNMTLAGQ